MQLRMLNEEYYSPLTSACDVINAKDRINTYYIIQWEQSFLLLCSPPSDPTGILNTFFLLWLFHIRTESLRGKVKIVAITTKSRVHDFFF